MTSLTLNRSDEDDFFGSSADSVKPLDAEPEEELPEPEDEGGVPHLIRVPSTGRNVYETVWTLLELSMDHTRELRAKRGMPDPWIVALGFRTACAENAERLAPVLEMFPPNELLRTGVAERDTRTRGLRISNALCGREYDEATGRWVTAERIIIPYITVTGRINLLRPHKKSLSNARWREREAMAEFYEKLHNNLRMVYGEAFLAKRPADWALTCIICEGEHKAAALRMLGIPAVAFQGIHFFRQNWEYKQAIKDTAQLLRDHGIREVIVVFDNEDKSHKKPNERFEAEIYARYTAECMEDNGFKALWGMLPDEWREDGKADWDSRLAWHVRTSGMERGFDKARTEFHKLLNDRPRKGAKPGTKFAINHVQRQVEFMSFKEDVINQALHKLRHEPQIFAGGRRELELATELENFCHKTWKHKLMVPTLCQALRSTHGGYYKHRACSDAMRAACDTAIEEIDEALEEFDGKPSLTEDEALEVRQLRAAKQAAYAIIYRYPKPFTDFTAESRYKVLVTEADGSLRWDRLVVFRDRHGVRSKPWQLPAKMMRSSQELRAFFLCAGAYHWKGGQDECDLFCEELDVKNYQRGIEEIDTYGWNREGKFYLLGDCAVRDGTGGDVGEFIFPDHDGVIWINGTGYKNSDNMAGFTSKPPILFPGAKTAKDAKAEYEAMDWEEERENVEAIWTDALRDFKASFTGYAGYAMIAGIIQYPAHPEVRPQIGGKPGLWVQGEKGSGKTKTTEYGMRLMGYPLNYGYISLGGTKVGVERSLCQFSCLPFHIDEWRNENADSKLEDLLRNCYNETATPKGTPNGNKAVRKLVPSTIPIVTGEDGTTDSALRSRYVRIIASQAVDHTQLEEGTEEERKAAATADQQRRTARYYRIMQESELYHRVGRYIFRHRAAFSEDVIKLTKTFENHPKVMAAIHDDRARQVFGVFYATLMAAQRLFSKDENAFGHAENANILDWFLRHGAESSEDTERDVFRRRFFTECVTMIDRGSVPGVDKFMRVRRGHITPDGKFKPIPAINDTEGRLYLLVAPGELFDAYKQHKRVVGENIPIAQANIQAELRQQPAWIPPKAKDRKHRFTVPESSEKSPVRTWWIMDYLRLEPELRATVQSIYERELREVKMQLADDGLTPEMMEPRAS